MTASRMPTPTQIAVMQRELEHLNRVDEEYRLTLKVLAVVAERYLEMSGQGAIVIEPEALGDPPDLITQRDPERGRISITVTR